MATPALLPRLLALRSPLQGRGLNHEGEAFTGRLHLRPLPGGAAVMLEYTATTDDGRCVHAEATLLGLAEDGEPCLWPVMEELPVVLRHRLLALDTGADAEEDALRAVFANAARDDSAVFREEITLALRRDGSLRLAHAWGLPGGGFDARSSCVLHPLPAPASAPAAGHQPGPGADPEPDPEPRAGPGDDPCDTVRRYWALMAGNDFPRLTEVLHPEVVLEWPQSGERFVGAQTLVRLNAEYPAHGPWRFELHRLIGQGGEVFSDVGVSDGVQTARCLGLHTVRAGRIVRMTEFWPEPFLPPHDRRHLLADPRP